MEVIRQEETNCSLCGAPITLHEYRGLEGGWYTEHSCTDFTRRYLEHRTNCKEPECTWCNDQRLRHL